MPPLPAVGYAVDSIRPTPDLETLTATSRDRRELLQRTEQKERPGEAEPDRNVGISLPTVKRNAFEQEGQIRGRVAIPQTVVLGNDAPH
jgi:hypothetical protein